jgi:hypothetical protein
MGKTEELSTGSLGEKREFWSAVRRVVFIAK